MAEEDIDCSPSRYLLCNVEVSRIDEWWRRHRQICPQKIAERELYLRDPARPKEDMPAIGYSIIITPTSAFDGIEVRCKCGEVVDVTHYEHI